MAKKPYLPDIDTIIKMGINPKTGLPMKMGNLRCMTKENIKKALRIVDEQDAVNRYKWYGLPGGLTSQELERWLYYRGQLCFFYSKEFDQFYFMGYAMDGEGPDFYGRYQVIHPIPLSGSKTQSIYFADKKFKCQYEIVLPDKLTLEDFENSAVLLHDYSKQLGQEIIPRQNVNDGILDIEAECMPYMRTALLMGTGVRGVRINDTDQEDSVREGSRNMTRGALEGDPYVPITGKIEFQELTNGTVTKAEDYLMSMQAIDNFRLSTYGIDNGGLFDKKSYVNNAQTNMNMAGGNIGLVMQDGLSIRQHFCNVVNSIWGIGIWCEPSEVLSQVDVNGDGVAYDREEETPQTSESEVDSNE